jgi:hypothetical protein
MPPQLLQSAAPSWHHNSFKAWLLHAWHYDDTARRRHDSSSHHHERANNDGDGLLRLSDDGSCRAVSDDDDLLWLNNDGFKAQGLNLGPIGLDLGLMFFFNFQKSIFGVGPLNQSIL